MTDDAPREGWDRLLADATLEGVLIHEGGRILHVNAALARLMRSTREALVGMSGFDFVAPEHRERLARHLATHSTEPLEGVALRTDGTTFPCELRGRTVEDGDRELRVVLVRDISDRVAMEATLHRRERQLASIAEHSPDVITRYDRDNRVQFMSRAVERATGQPPEAFLGKRLVEIGFPPELVARWEAINARVFATGLAEEADFEFPAPDGETRYYQTRVVPERNEAGIVEHVLTTTRDLTALKRAEQSAREAYAALRGLIDQSLTGVYVIQDGRFAYANARLAEIFGYGSYEELLAMPVEELVHPDDRGLVAEDVRRRMAGEPRAVHYFFRGMRRDGRMIHVEVHATAAEYHGRAALVGSLLEVTERLQLEERMRQGQKMEALGQLAGGVAHDFNNILAAISGHAQLLLADLPGHDPRRSDVEEILRASQRGAGVTRQLLAFSRRQAIETEVIDLAAVVRELGLMLGQLLPRTITLTVPDAGASAHVRATRTQLEQIVVNLALNGRDAMPGGGTLELDVRESPAGAYGAGRRALLTVRDNGLGMSPEVQARAFEPFFTTKRKEQGTGLGLATVYGLVRQFGGDIEIESTVGTGTTVVVSLPVVAATPTLPVAVPVPAGAGLRRRVLLAEDEAAIRTLTRRVLERAGYDVLEAPDGAAAVAVLRSAEPLDLLLTDAAMPELSGVELAREAAALRPGLPVLLMSGYAELSGVALAPSGAVEGVTGLVGFVEKPFAMERLVATVGRALAGTKKPPASADGASHAAS
jgi:two-component system cell cycle sensor histidine kinase/response regulator CckA